ncbi:MAG: hypothetical protein CK427_15565 [Leptospira sp.]|nr:MAG: hypothetical protein CK427_15565 [Leptospira sp.]
MDSKLKLTATSTKERYLESLSKLNFKTIVDLPTFKRYKFGNEIWGGESAILDVNEDIQIKYTKINVIEDFTLEFNNNGTLDYEFIICIQGLSYIHCPSYFDSKIEMCRGIYLFKEGMHTSTLWYYPANQIHETLTLKISKEWFKTNRFKYNHYKFINKIISFLNEKQAHELVFKSGKLTNKLNRFIRNLKLAPIKTEFEIMQYDAISTLWISLFLSDLDLVTYDDWIHSNYIKKHRITKNTIRKIEHIQFAIQTDLSKTINLNKLSKEYGISQGTLQVGFQSLYGCTIFEFIRSMRISLAKKYLLENYSVKETADLVGYKNTSHFIFFFKKMIGITPKQFQKSRLKD